MHGNYIDGEWTTTRGGRVVPNRNPAHVDMVLGEFPDSTAADVADAVAAASHAFASWRALPMPQRGEILFRVAELLAGRSAEVAEIITREQGKTIREAREEVAEAIGILRYYAGEARQPAGELYPSSASGTMLYTRCEPIGPVGLITPWNFPLSIPVSKVAPALIFGNTVVLKPAGLTPWSGATVVSLFEEAGLPPGVLNLVQGNGAVVGEALIGHQQLAGLSFTGSLAVGREIQRRLIDRNGKFQLDLGGKNPLVVLGDADVDQAVRWSVSGAMRMAGQRSTATSRVIVDRRIADEFTAKLIARVRELRVGDGMQPGTIVGPLISEAQQARVLDYLQIGLSEGAEVLAGGDVIEHDGYDDGFYIAPTVFAQVQPGMRIMQEEIFGPVIGVITAQDLDHAIEIANSVPYGLSASIATRNLAAAMHFADVVAAGVVHINRDAAKIDFHAPFGGIKASSAHHRNLGKAARDFFTETKTVYVRE